MIAEDFVEGESDTGYGIFWVGRIVTTIEALGSGEEKLVESFFVWGGEGNGFHLMRVRRNQAYTFSIVAANTQRQNSQISKLVVSLGLYSREGLYQTSTNSKSTEVG